MSDGDALLAAIMSDPDEDVPRLAYADWLDEHGDAERAAFIRLQVEGARLLSTDQPQEAMKVLFAAQKVLSVHLERWLHDLLARGGPAAAWIPQKGWKFRRGFPEELKLADCVTDELATDLAASPALAGVARLTLTYNYQPMISGAGMTALAGSPQLKSLRHLSVVGLIATGVAEALAASPVMAQLQALDLSHSAFNDAEGIGDRGAEAIAASPGAAGLTSLSLDASSLGDRGVAAIASSPHLKRLTDLDLACNRIGPASARSLAAGLTGLRTLILAYTLIGDDGAAALAAAAHVTNLTQLNLGACDIGDRGAAALAASPHLGQLVKLDLRENQIGDRGAAALAASPHLGRLVELDLSHNQIGPAGVAAIKMAPGRPWLKSLSIAFNPGDKP